MKQIAMILALTLVSVVDMVSCEDKDAGPMNVIMAIGNGGNFSVVNMDTNDTLRVADGITIDGSYETLEVHKGNRIKITFEPKEEYSNYNFRITYTLPNDEVIKNQSQYEYTVGDDLEGSYKIGLSALSNGETKHKQWTISASGAFILKVVQ